MEASRREFLTAALAIPCLHPGGDDVLRVGLIGCGGRGTGAAAQALKADSNVKLVAMGDLFPERIERSLGGLKDDGAIAPKIDVPAERRFGGFDNYKGVIAHSDVVLLCEPPHYRPAHLKAAIEAGKHVFAEKPVAVDAPGVRSVLATCEEAKRKKLSVVSGLCLRYANSFREAMKRIHGGAIGDIVALEANDYRGSRWAIPRKEGWSDLEWQTRNWYNFTWLSGDFNVEQHVHFLDVCAWANQERYPDRAIGMGGRQIFTAPEHGNIYDHFSVAYEYDSGVRFYSNTRHHPKCASEMSARVLGTKGRAKITEGHITIEGPEPWEFKGKDNPFYQTEHDELFRSIRTGTPINNGDYMAKSTLLAIQGRMSAYTGQRIGWAQAMASKEDLTPPKYEWGPHEAAPIALPGRTEFR